MSEVLSLSPSGSVFYAVLQRDMRLAMRRRGEAALPLAFFLVSTALYPLGVGPEPHTLRLIAGGVLWVSALLASLLSLQTLFAADHADGTLEQMLLSQEPLWRVGLAKVCVHWLLSGLPLVLLSPLLGLQYQLDGEALWMLPLGLLLGTPVLSLIGAVGAALTLGLRSAGSLILLLVLPLCIPVLIFGAGAVQAVDSGISASGHLSLLAAILIVTLMGAPVAMAMALRISME